MRKRIVLCIALLTVIALIAGAFYATAEDEFVYLSDMKAKSVKVGWGELGVDKGLDGNPIKIANEDGGTTIYKKGLCAHAGSTIVYDLTGGVYSEFLAYIGVHEGTNNNSKDAASVAFEVKIDGKSVYKSSVMKMKTPALQISVPVPVGAQKLELITTDGGDGNTGDHSTWAEAKLRVGEADPDMVVDLYAVPEMTEGAVGSTVKFDITQKRFDGTVDKPDVKNVSFSVSNNSVADVDKNGVVTFKSIGSVTVYVELTHDDGKISKEVRLRCFDSSIQGSNWTVESPSGNNVINIAHGIYGELTYSVKHGDEIVVEPSSDMGLVANEEYFADGFRFVSVSENRIDEEYTNLSGKTSKGHNFANEITVRFEKGDFYFDVVARAYNDGFAYRYNIEYKGDDEQGTITFTSEHTSFVLPSQAVAYSIVIEDLTKVFNHENSYNRIKSDSITTQYMAFPILYKTVNDNWVLLTEAELYGDLYYGSIVQGENNRVLRFHQAPRINTGTVTTSINFTSPWRMGIIGDLEGIVESNLVEDVHVRTDKDYSWVQPGVTSWMWLSEGYDGQHNEEKLKEYIDLAYDMGWSYLILDEGWQPPAPAGSKRRYQGYYAYFDRLVEYASERNIGLIAWIRLEDFDTPEEREIIREWADKGLKGIKADFFDSENAETMEIYKALYEICTEENMLINCHGANKPSGERQYYPNVINREAVLGEEYGGLDSSNTTMWAYIRGVVGPVDITPRLYPTHSSNITVVHELALNIVFESGMPCMASSANEYLTTDAYLLLKDLPSAWDEIEYIEGAPGIHTVLARRLGTQWYLGGINNSGKKEITVKLDFLDEGAEYLALIFTDGNGKYDIVTDTKKVKYNDEMVLKMPTAGGFAVRFIKCDETSKIESITAEKKSYTVKAGESFEIDAKIAPADLLFDDLIWTSSDESVAIVERGSVNALREGKVVIKATSYFDSNVNIEVEVTVSGGQSLNSKWNILDPTIAKYGYYIKNDTKLALKTLSGDINGSYRNVFYIDAPEGDFEVVVRVTGMFNSEGQTAGIIVFSETMRNHAIAVAKRYYDPVNSNYNLGNYYELYSYKGTSFNNNTSKSVGNFPNVYLKLEYKDGVVRGYTSLTGTGSWTPIVGTCKDNEMFKAGKIKIGLFGCAGSAGDITDISFDSFTLNGKQISFVGEDSEISKVVSYNAPSESIVAEVGTSAEDLALPESITFTLENGDTFTSAVEWSCDTFASDKTGEYTFTATVKEIPENVDASTVVANVKVVLEEKAVTSSPVVTDTPAQTEPVQNDGGNDTLVIIIIASVAAVAVIAAIVIIVIKKRKK